LVEVVELVLSTALTGASVETTEIEDGTIVGSFVAIEGDKVGETELPLMEGVAVDTN
jgi:hypothetical protein